MKFWALELSVMLILTILALDILINILLFLMFIKDTPIKIIVKIILLDNFYKPFP